MEKVFISNSEAETAQIAVRLAKVTKRGDVWALRGTLGMGKSVFARAFIQFFVGSEEEVPSPTFTLVQNYYTDAFDIFHYDLYRLKEASEIFELGVEEAFYDGVSLVEWPEKMGSFAPRDMWQVEFVAQGEARKITISATNEDKIRRLANV